MEVWQCDKCKTYYETSRTGKPVPIPFMQSLFRRLGVFSTDRPVLPFYGLPVPRYLKPAASHEVLESMFLESNIRGSRFILPASFRRSTRPNALWAVAINMQSAS